MQSDSAIRSTPRRVVGFRGGQNGRLTAAHHPGSDSGGGRLFAIPPVDREEEVRSDHQTSPHPRCRRTRPPEADENKRIVHNERDRLGAKNIRRTAVQVDSHMS